MSLSDLSENSSSRSADSELEKEEENDVVAEGVSTAKPPEAVLSGSQSVAAANMIDFLDQV